MGPRKGTVQPQANWDPEALAPRKISPLVVWLCTDAAAASTGARSTSPARYLPAQRALPRADAVDPAGWDLDALDRVAPTHLVDDLTNDYRLDDHPELRVFEDDRVTRPPAGRSCRSGVGASAAPPWRRWWSGAPGLLHGPRGAADLADGGVVARGDIAENASVDSVVDEPVAGLGGPSRCDAAGVNGHAPAAEHSEADRDRMFAPTGKGTLLTVQVAGRHLRDGGGSTQHGSAGARGGRPARGLGVVARRRDGVDPSVGQEWARHGIRVSCVAPLEETRLFHRIRDALEPQPGRLGGGPGDAIPPGGDGRPGARPGARAGVPGRRRPPVHHRPDPGRRRRPHEARSRAPGGPAKGGGRRGPRRRGT